MKSRKKKVVYNNCFGGFGLSDEAIIWLEQNAKDENLLSFIKEKRKVFTKEKENGLVGLLNLTIEKRISTALYFHFCEHGIPRHHPDLIEVVKKLKDKVNTPYSDLKIATLKGNKYRIDVYDGWETVMEPGDDKFITIED